MALGPVRQGTVSAEIRELAAALLDRQREPIRFLESRRSELNQRGNVLGALRTRLSALRSALDALASPGTLSPFAAKAATSSEPGLVGASATASAAAGALSITVAQLARRATHVSDRFTDDATAIADQGAGTFAFTVRVGTTDYAVSVDVTAGQTDREVLEAVALAITDEAGSAASALRIQTETGRSRLSVSSATTGTAGKLTFTDTDGLLTRLGLVRGTPTQATDTTGGYVYEDLGNHELDARLVVDGLTYYRESNTVTDLVTGLTLSLKATTTAAVTVKIQPDAEQMLAEIRDFVTRYNDVLDHLAQHTFVDPKAGTRGVLALDPVFSGLAGQLRLKIASRVASQAAGKPDSLAVLGVVAGPDGKLSIKNEAALRDTLTSDPGAVATLFAAADGVATTLETFVDGYARGSGQIASTQGQITRRINGLNAQIDRMNAALARRQAILEDQLARSQALLQTLSRQAAQINSMLGAG